MSILSMEEMFKLHCKICGKCNVANNQSYNPDPHHPYETYCEVGRQFRDICVKNLIKEIKKGTK